VAGRCVGKGAVPAISTARRMLYDPVEIGYVRRERQPELPSIAALGRSDGAIAFLRFSIALPPEAGVVEAYLLLDRVTDVDSDPEPIALHLAGVIDAWDARSLSWAVQPRVEEIGSPVTRVHPASGALVRLDARALVERWRRRRSTDFGLAVVSDAPGASGTGSPTGMAFALAPIPPGAGDAPAREAAPRGPRLELYIR
jgi:hypothetical protein